ncbi:MAG: hypothetical protein HN691_14385, partial [Bacteroidetes bacterium]|nr:hypothetical protein [Bacteroidota bacterium]
MKHIVTYIILLSLTLTFSSCEFMFGTKKNSEVDDIFIQGNIDPNLAPSDVGYVPILPIWDDFQNPVDVFVGYDEMVYVVDDNGLHILDLKGQLHRT